MVTNNLVTWQLVTNNLVTWLFGNRQFGNQLLVTKNPPITNVPRKINKSLNNLVYKFINESLYRSFNKSLKTSTNKSVNKSLKNPSINQSIN